VPKLRKFVENLKAPFTKAFWEDNFGETDDEKLVDRGLLSYAYMEIGLIETIGELVYSPSEFNFGLLTTNY
jgi:sodium/potassium-transporting ATPase subunit alpha